MASPDLQLHAFFFPLMAPGHLIPMTDLAGLFARRGIKATMITTPANAGSLRLTVDEAQSSGLPLHLLQLRFSHAVAGPESLTSPDASTQFFNSLEDLRRPFEQLLRDHRPDCVISDMYLPWTADVANELGVPRLVFHTMGFFPLCVLDGLDRFVAGGGSVSARGTVVVPGLPDKVEMKLLQLHDSVLTRNEFGEFMIRMVESELKSLGAVVNSFYEMEPAYADHYRKVMGRKAWHVGPVSLCNRVNVDLAGSPEENRTRPARVPALDWLDAQKPNSVIYVCFGSLCRLTKLQTTEIALGLESTGRPFIWVMRNDGRDSSEWIPAGLEERCLIIRGWAPQVLILSHRAIGGFVTHCGWNSVMEGVSAGVPMVTWPLCAEQFYNEKLVVEVLRIGVRSGVEVWSMEEEEKPVLGREAVEKAVAQLMDGGEEAEGRRRRAVELREMAAGAVRGSSDDDMSHLLKELVELSRRKVR